MAGPVAVILAGGRGSRLGTADKALAPLGGRPLIARVIARIAPQVACILINANGDPARFAGLDLPVVPDDLPGLPGPLAGILAGLDAAARLTPVPDRVLIVPTDTPFLPQDLAAHLAEGLPPGTIAVAASGGGVHHTVALIPVRLRDDLRAHLARTGGGAVAAWYDRHPLRRVAFADHAGVDPFFNVNTPADLAAAGRLLDLRPIPLRPA